MVDVAKNDEDKVVRLIFRGENRPQAEQEPVAVGTSENKEG